ncbi:tRNA (adenosine(37)-N6)-threonylcarbamoyltransferase complex transferase subunit TsaD [Melioribacteraceae bacterium 4301-Me]|uniref:tRNA (adenosine(37)-N6)-threonylcarbamoyltransferase complex transferase subunit TsaD n=1 Tax=Pyranulibacter aquaticus TaxID=3163344 RepID=UPI00359B36DF
MNILGIETSCDETSVAILVNDEVKVNLVSSQDFHINYGGVVPELSSRAHLQIIIPLLRQALEKLKLSIEEIDLISATAGPGLIGALLVGLTFAKGLAFSLNKPFVPVDHIEGHIFSAFLQYGNSELIKPNFPYLCLVVSGGHTLLLLVKSDLEIIKLGTTVDDAAGEAFDKVAKMIGLGYPGGPKIQSLAYNYTESNLISFPVSKTQNDYDFSFSGLKTAVLRYVLKEYGSREKIKEEDKPKIAASFQNAVVKALTKNVEKALSNYKVDSFALVGGVAANKFLRDELAELTKKYGIKFVVPSLEFCGDNGAMIAYRAWRLHLAGRKFNYEYNAYPSLKENKLIVPEL